MLMEICFSAVKWQNSFKRIHSQNGNKASWKSFVHTFRSQSRMFILKKVKSTKEGGDLFSDSNSYFAGAGADLNEIRFMQQVNNLFSPSCRCPQFHSKTLLLTRVSMRKSINISKKPIIENSFLYGIITRANQSFRFLLTKYFSWSTRCFDGL